MAPLSKDKISVVIPVYGSEKSLPVLVPRLIAVLSELAASHEIILVNDCSPDGAWDAMRELKDQYSESLKIVRLLVNTGQHNAILCGFSLVTGDIVVTMDDDLQNPPEEIPKLVTALGEGYDLVVAAYDSKKHSAFRNAGGGLVDRMQRSIFNLPANFQLTSFRAIRRTVVDHVNQMVTPFPYVTAMLLASTAKRQNVEVRHEAREFGKSSYNLRRSLSLMLNLVLNYSPYPLYLVGLICAFAFLFALGFGIHTIWSVLTQGVAVAGWASTVVIMSFFNALVLLCLLIFGFYISRFHQQLSVTRTSYRIADIHE